MANNDYISNIIRKILINSGVVKSWETPSGRSAANRAIALDLAGWGHIWNDIIYPLLAGPEDSPYQKYSGVTSKGHQFTYDGLDPVYGGIHGHTLAVEPWATAYGPECLWVPLGSEDLGRGRPATIAEAIYCIISQIEALDTEFADAYDDAWIKEKFACVDANFDRVTADVFGCSYDLDCDPDSTQAFSVLRHIYEIFQQVIDGGPDLGLDFSCEGEYPTLSIPVYASTIIWDICIPTSYVCSLDDYLLSIWNFTGMDPWDTSGSSSGPDYSGYGLAGCHLADGTSLEEALAILDEAICAICEEGFGEIIIEADGGTISGGTTTYTASDCMDTMYIRAGTGIDISGAASDGITISNTALGGTLQEAYDEGAASTGGILALDNTYPRSKIVIIDDSSSPIERYLFGIRSETAYPGSGLALNFNTCDLFNIGELGYSQTMIFTAGLHHMGQLGSQNPFNFNVVNNWAHPVCLHEVADNFVPPTTGKCFDEDTNTLLSHPWGATFEIGQEGSMFVAQGTAFEQFGDEGQNTNFPWGSGGEVLDACGDPLVKGQLYYREPGMGNIWRLTTCPKDNQGGGGLNTLYNIYLHGDEDGVVGGPGDGTRDGGAIVLDRESGGQPVEPGSPINQTAGIEIFNGPATNDRELEQIGVVWGPCPADQKYYPALFMVRDYGGGSINFSPRFAIATRANGECDNQYIIGQGFLNTPTPNNPDRIHSAHFGKSVVYLEVQEGNGAALGGPEGVQPSTGACEGAIYIDGGAAGATGKLVYREPNCGAIHDLTSGGGGASPTLWHSINMDQQGGKIDAISPPEVYTPSTTTSTLNFRSLPGISFHVLSGGVVGADTLGIGVDHNLAVVNDGPTIDLANPTDGNTVTYDATHSNADGSFGAFVASYHWDAQNVGGGAGLTTGLNQNATHMLEFRSLVSANGTLNIVENLDTISLDVNINTNQIEDLVATTPAQDGDTIVWDSTQNNGAGGYVTKSNYGKNITNVGVGATDVVKLDANGTAQIRGLKAINAGLVVQPSISGDEIEIAGGQLEGMANVNAPAPQAGDTLFYDANTSEWVAAAGQAPGAGTSSGANVLQISDGAGGFTHDPKLSWDSQKSSILLDGTLIAGPALTGQNLTTVGLADFFIQDIGTSFSKIIRFMDMPGGQGGNEVGNISIGEFTAGPMTLSMLTINANADFGVPSEAAGASTALGIGVLGGDATNGSELQGGTIALISGSGANTDVMNQAAKDSGSIIIEVGDGGAGANSVPGGKGGMVNIRSGAGGSGTVGGAGGEMFMQPGSGGNLQAPNTGDGGDLEIRTGEGAVGGQIMIEAGESHGDNASANVLVRAGNTTNTDAGHTIVAGGAYTGSGAFDAGSVTIQGGIVTDPTSHANGGNVGILGGCPQQGGSGNGGNIQLFAPSGGAGLSESTTVTTLDSNLIPPGSYFTLQSREVGVVVDYAVWFEVGGQGGSPNLPGVNEIQVVVGANDTAASVAVAIEAAMNAYQQPLGPMPVWNLATGQGNNTPEMLTIMNTAPGNMQDAQDSQQAPTGFTVIVDTQGIDNGMAGNVSVTSDTVNFASTGGLSNETHVHVDGFFHVTKDVTIDGKLNVLGAIDPTMLYLTHTVGIPQGPGTGPSEGVIFVDSGDGNLYFQPENNGSPVNLSSSATGSTGPVGSGQVADTGTVLGGDLGFTYASGIGHVGIGVTSPNGIGVLPLCIEGGTPLDCVTNSGTVMIGPEDGLNLTIGHESIDGQIALQAKDGADTPAVLHLNPCGDSVIVNGLAQNNAPLGHLSVNGSVGAAHGFMAWQGGQPWFSAFGDHIASIPNVPDLNSGVNGGGMGGASAIIAQQGAPADDGTATGGDGADMYIVSGDGGSAVEQPAGSAGDVFITSGNGGLGVADALNPLGQQVPGDAGTINIIAGDGGGDTSGIVNVGAPGHLNMRAGNSQLSGGNIDIMAGD